MRLIARATGILAAAIAAALSVSAQVPGLPVYNQGVPHGIGVYGDVGFPNGDAGGGTAYGVTGRAGFGVFGVTAIVSTYDPDGPAGGKASAGATGNLRVFGGPLVPLSVTLQGGVGYATSEGLLPNDNVTVWRFPVGLGFALTIPNPALAIKPWLAPRVDFTTSSDSLESETRFALSGGIELNLLNGFGLHAAYDRIFDNGSDPSTFGVGAHFVFRVPGL